MRISGKGLIDRDAPVRFVFDGKTIEAFRGDTVASALLANDVRLVGRSFKYHRPRGILTAGSEEPNALLEIVRGNQITPNVRATVQEAFDGLTVRSQNR
ncbi:MAG: 2Fe-2S iron-sulfur cluster-binding protein, partial [Pseudomonadota bacterium]